MDPEDAALSFDMDNTCANGSTTTTGASLAKEGSLREEVSSYEVVPEQSGLQHAEQMISPLRTEEDDLDFIDDDDVPNQQLEDTAGTTPNRHDNASYTPEETVRDDSHSDLGAEECSRDIKSDDDVTTNDSSCTDMDSTENFSPRVDTTDNTSPKLESNDNSSPEMDTSNSTPSMDTGGGSARISQGEELPGEEERETPKGGTETCGVKGDLEVCASADDERLEQEGEKDGAPAMDERGDELSGEKETTADIADKSGSDGGAPDSAGDVSVPVVGQEREEKGEKEHDAATPSVQQENLSGEEGRATTDSTDTSGGDGGVADSAALADTSTERKAKQEEEEEEEEEQDVVPSSGDPEQLPTTPAPHPQQNDILSRVDTSTVSQEAGQSECTEQKTMDSLDIMEANGETFGGKSNTKTSDDTLTDNFENQSEPLSNGIMDNPIECTLRIDEIDDVVEKENNREDKESSPEVEEGSVESVENVTLKDATSEKALLGNGDAEELSQPRDSLGSRTDEEKRKSSSDIDMDFAVLELDSSHLNLDFSKEKSSLRKKGSLARRKKPSRGSVTNTAPGSPDSIFQDTTEVKQITSPTSDTAEDEVFDKHSMPSKPQTEAPPSECIAVRKAALPFRPHMVMPGLQDLSKSKLFNQERKKSGENPTSPLTSPVDLSSPQSPAHQVTPPQVLPKPPTKVQKESQNKTIAAGSSSHDADNKPTGDGDISHNNSVPSNDDVTPSSGVITASVEEVLVTTKDDLTDAFSLEGPKPARSDSGSLMGTPGRKDSWSSVSSPRRLSRGESVSSVEGGEGGSASSTPRRASIQGSAYAPIGFRPRRSSSIILDSNSKLVENPSSPSPTPSSSTTSSLAEDSEAMISSVKSPLYTPPAWLSEMKAKTAGMSGDASSRIRSPSGGSVDDSATLSSPSQSRPSSESVESAERGAEERPQGEGASSELNQKAQQEQEPERPSWMKASQETAPSADKLQQNEKVGQENGEEEEDQRPVPPWAAELKKKKRPFVTSRSFEAGGESNGKLSVSPYRKNSTDKENTPVASSGRDDYSPSWMKTGQQLKKPPVPPPVAAKPSVTVGTKPAKPAKPAKAPTDNPMKAYETPKWKLDLAEKKKRREEGMMSAADNSNSTSAASDVPQWRQELLRKKRPSSEIIRGVCAEPDREEGAEPAWAKKTEERRARLMKTGLFDQASATEES